MDYNSLSTRIVVSGVAVTFLVFTINHFELAVEVFLQTRSADASESMI